LGRLAVKNARLIAICVGLLIVALVVKELAGLSDDGPAYTVFSSTAAGASLFKDTLEEMNYPVGISYEKINADASLNDTHVLIEPEMDENDLSSLLAWVSKGGRAVLMGSPTVIGQLSYLLLMDYSNRYREAAHGAVSECQLGYGTLLYGSSQVVLNKQLMENSASGKTITGFLSSWKSPQIYFNEYYHGYRYEANSWDKLPSGLRALVLQIGVAAAMLVWFLGFRFGKPVPLIEGVERDESEYCIALANLERKAGMSEGALEDLQQALLRKCARAFHAGRKLDKESLAKLWAMRSLSGAKNIELAFPGELTDKRQLAEAAAAICALEAVLRKRAAKRSTSVSQI
jgi:hypothetical protein